MVCCRCLCIILAKNCRAILRTYIVPLAVQRGWVVRYKKYFKQGVKANDGSIKGDLNRLSVPRVTITDLFICRVAGVPANVAGYHFADAIQLTEDWFCAPEATACEDGNLFVTHFVFLKILVANISQLI